MERFVCLEHGNRNDDWASMNDGYKADLWSIEPYIQVSGVGENDTIIVEKAWGARIELQNFTDISAMRIGFWRAMQIGLAGFTLFPPLDKAMRESFTKAKYKFCYPRLFAFEGFMKLEDIEEKLFGCGIGLLVWSTNTSVFSKHAPGNPVYEPKFGVSGDEKKAFAGFLAYGSSDLGADIDLEALNSRVPIPNGNGFAVHANGPPIPDRDSIEGDDGRIKTYPVIGRQPWRECSCGSSASDDCSCPDLTHKKLSKMGRSPMGEDKVRDSITRFNFNEDCN
jgi:hypothetical protein